MLKIKFKNKIYKIPGRYKKIKKIPDFSSSTKNLLEYMEKTRNEKFKYYKYHLRGQFKQKVPQYLIIGKMVVYRVRFGQLDVLLS